MSELFDSTVVVFASYLLDLRVVSVEYTPTLQSGAVLRCGGPLTFSLSRNGINIEHTRIDHYTHKIWQAFEILVRMNKNLDDYHKMYKAVAEKYTDE